VDNDKLERFKKIYTQFIHGTKWLNGQMAKGINVDREKKEFISSVINPMDALWATFTDQEKDYWAKVDVEIKKLQNRATPKDERKS
jgi:hypothetical protein